MRTSLASSLSLVLVLAASRASADEPPPPLPPLPPAGPQGEPLPPLPQAAPVPGPLGEPPPPPPLQQAGPPSAPQSGPGVMGPQAAPSSPSEAQRRRDARDSAPRAWSLTLEAAPGFAVFFKGQFPSYAIGGDAIFRYGMLQVGAFRDATLEPRFGGLRSQSTGGMLGVRLFANGIRGFDALVTGGLHEYQGVGSERLAGSRGGTGSSPFVGLRLGGTATLGSSVARLSSGLFLFALFDLTRQAVAVTRPGDFGPQKSDEATVGDIALGLTMRFGLDVGP